MARIKHEQNPDAVEYKGMDAVYQTDVLGTVRITSVCDRLPVVGSRWGNEYGEYYLRAFIDDTLKINGKTYTQVFATTTARGEDADYYIPRIESWRTPLTPAAATAVREAIEPIFARFLNEHGGKAAVKKTARNEHRQREIDSLRRKIAQMEQDAAAIEADMEG